MLFAPLVGWRHVKVTERRTIFEVHHTPKHASGLNTAECELSFLGRQCLDRRIDSQQLLTTEVADWQHPRNEAEGRVDWQFRTADARVKLKRLDPLLEQIAKMRSRVSSRNPLRR